MGQRPARYFRVRGPLERSDLPGLYARVCGLLGEHTGETVVCDAEGVRPDAVAVEALARLRLGATHHGCDVELRTDSLELVELIAFMGLTDAIRPVLRVEVER
jgi:ABC-type transporter Mla MlaB component